MLDPDRHLKAAHDVAAAEWDDDARRDLYRQLYLSCLSLGRWSDCKIFQPFTGDEEEPGHVERIFWNAIKFGRIDDALEGADVSGLPLSEADLVWLAERAAESRPIDDVTRQALWLATNCGRRHFGSRLAVLLVQTRGQQLRHVEEIALGYALRAYHEDPPWVLE